MNFVHMIQCEIHLREIKSKKLQNNENLPLKVLSMDVDNDDSVRNTIHKILHEKKKIDILINNAGYGLFDALKRYL